MEVHAFVKMALSKTVKINVFKLLNAVIIKKMLTVCVNVLMDFRKIQKKFVLKL